MLKRNHTNLRLYIPKLFPTRQMQRWINQAKSRLQNIIAQAKGDGQNVSLRVAFVG